jgi:hypothetical protein
MTEEHPASRRFLRAELAGELVWVKEWGLTPSRESRANYEGA